MNLLIADDHTLLRRGLLEILAEEFPDAVFGEAATTQETRDRLSERAWDVLVLDIFMPGRSGLEILEDIRRRRPRPAVLVLSSAPEEQLALRVLRAGANGYLNKQAAPEELVHAVRRLLEGRHYVSAGMAERLAAEAGQLQIPAHATLSNREFEVFQLLVSGRSLKEIAQQLSISAKTVSTFHIRIWEKLGVHNDVEMVRYAMEHGLVGQC